MRCKILGDTRLYEAMARYDEDLAKLSREAGCPECAGALHRANYPRKPRGWVAPQPEGYDRRHSACCEGPVCRKRTTPPSLRFLGRRVYLGAVVVLVTAMRHGVTPRRAAELADLVGVSRRTLERWRVWWLTVFTTTPLWQVIRGLWVPEVPTESLPGSLLERFEDPDELMSLVQLLDLIKPLTTKSGARQLMVG